MKKLLYVIIVLLSLLGCTSSLHIKTRSIETIIIKETNSDLLKYINSSSREFFIFKAKYTITISYGDKTTKTILLKDEMLKIDGVTYRTSKHISMFIETYLKNDTEDGCMP